MTTGESLKKIKVDGLRKLAGDIGIDTSGQKKAEIISFLLFWDVLRIINDWLAPLSLFFHELQQNSQFLRTISNYPDLGRLRISLL